MVKRSMRILQAGIILVIGGAAGWFLGPLIVSTVTSGYETLSSSHPAPGTSGVGAAEAIADTAALVASADAIITGTVTSAVFIGYSSGYDESGALVIVEETVVPLGLPLTEFDVSVDNVIMDDGVVGSAQTIRMRMLGIGNLKNGNPCGGGNDDTPLNVVGETYFLFLTKEPDGVAYGLYHGPYSRLTLEEPEVKATTCSPQVIYWTEETSPAGFMAEVLDELG